MRRLQSVASRPDSATTWLFDYEGRGHLFTDPSLPDEYDPSAAALLWERVLGFCEAASRPDAGKLGVR